jgi:hypothetical protein
MFDLGTVRRRFDDEPGRVGADALLLINLQLERSHAVRIAALAHELDGLLAVRDVLDLP